MLYQLKRASIARRDLVRIYTSVIRPVLEYVYPAWYTSFPKYLIDKIEIIQNPSMNVI